MRFNNVLGLNLLVETAVLTLEKIYCLVDQLYRHYKKGRKKSCCFCVECNIRKVLAVSCNMLGTMTFL